MTLAESIQAKIYSRELPATQFDRTWYGRGQSDPCSACGLPVTTNQIEVEGDLHHTRADRDPLALSSPPAVRGCASAEHKYEGDGG